MIWRRVTQGVRPGLEFGVSCRHTHTLALQSPSWDWKQGELRVWKDTAAGGGGAGSWQRMLGGVAGVRTGS